MVFQPEPGENPPPRRLEEEAKLSGRFVRLKPVVPDDYGFIFNMSTSPRSLIRWRYRGAPPGPDVFTQTLWQGVLTQFLVVKADRGEPVGLVIAYNADLRNQITYFGLLIAEQFERQGWVLEGAFLFLDYLFATWNIRKVYLEASEFNYADIAGGEGKYFHVEGCLRDHEFHDGQYWHRYILALYRDEWLETRRAHFDD